MSTNTNFHLERRPHVEFEKMFFSPYSCCARRLQLHVISAGRKVSRRKGTSPRLLNYGAFAGATKPGTKPSRCCGTSLRLLSRFLRASASESIWREDIVVLGVESSCDDTGVAVMRGTGQLLGEALHSQAEVHKTYVRLK